MKEIFNYHGRIFLYDPDKKPLPRSKSWVNGRLMEYIVDALKKYGPMPALIITDVLRREHKIDKRPTALANKLSSYKRKYGIKILRKDDGFAFYAEPMRGGRIRSIYYLDGQEDNAWEIYKWEPSKKKEETDDAYCKYYYWLLGISDEEFESETGINTGMRN